MECIEDFPTLTSNMLTLRKTWFEDGRMFVRWSPNRSGLLKHVETVFYDQLKLPSEELTFPLLCSVYSDCPQKLP